MEREDISMRPVIKCGAWPAVVGLTEAIAQCFGARLLPQHRCRRWNVVQQPMREGAAHRIADLVASRKLTVFPIAIGDQANIAQLAHLSPMRPPLRLKGLNFREFFLWLSRSVSRVSQSTPGESVPLDTDGIKAWGQV